MILRIRDPFDEVSRLHEDMERHFNSFYGREGHKQLPLKQGGEGKELADLRRFRTPLSNIYETENSVIATFELPGVEKNEIELNVTDTHIEVKVERSQKSKIYGKLDTPSESPTKAEKEEKHKGVYRYESRSSQFYRALPLPAEVQSEKANAECKNGVLRVEIPKVKKVEEKKKKIAIK